MGLIVTFSFNDAQNNDTSISICCVIICRVSRFHIVVLSVSLLSVIKLGVILLSVGSIILMLNAIILSVAYSHCYD
jgi:hypothetical protein